QMGERLVPRQAPPSAPGPALQRFKLLRAFGRELAGLVGRTLVVDPVPQKEAIPPVTARHAGVALSLDEPLQMGVLNVTPDSINDGGRHVTAEAPIEHGLRHGAEGADIVDVGGESTRPGAQPVVPAQELERVAPVVEALVARGAAVSVDTRHAEVMREVLRLGADMINDVGGFRDPDAIAAVAASTCCAVCVMHMQGEPGTMQREPRYLDVVREVRDFLCERAAALQHAGIAAGRIVVDPGFGFGKTLEHNVMLGRSLGMLAEAGYPVLVGASRKSMIGALTGREPGGRIFGSVAAALALAARGARVLRVHDVAATRDALAVWRALGPS
ncbi:MAG: dihydropteroate synthase, partial [Burkholderiales bacterium]